MEDSIDKATEKHMMEKFTEINRNKKKKDEYVTLE